VTFKVGRLFMSAKRFFYSAAGLFLLTAAYTLGAGRAQGQSPTNRVVGVSNATLDNGGGSPRDGLVVLTENGDWYFRVTMPDPTWPNAPWVRGGNIGIGPVGAESVPWSGAKGSYRK
jgi:hypothetical protein